ARARSAGVSGRGACRATMSAVGSVSAIEDSWKVFDGQGRPGASNTEPVRFVYERGESPTQITCHPSGCCCQLRNRFPNVPQRRFGVRQIHRAPPVIHFIRVVECIIVLRANRGVIGLIRKGFARFRRCAEKRWVHGACLLVLLLAVASLLLAG